MSNVSACIDRFLFGAEAHLQARERAFFERLPHRGGAVGLKRLALDGEKQWPRGACLRVRFLEGPRALHKRVLAIARRFTAPANLTLLDVTERPDAESELRLSFGLTGDRSCWSFIGTDCLAIAPYEPTMNLGTLAACCDPQRFQGVVLHEFGHALGCVHEHQSPAAGIPWNLPALFRHYAAPPNFWKPEQVLHNVVRRYSGTRTQYSDFDPRSIMVYPISRELTDGVFEVAANHALSATDIEFVRSIYA